MLTCNWTGQSGAVYTYTVYPKGYDFPKNAVGNYIFAGFAEKQYVPIYIGEGILSERCGDKHHAMACIVSKGAIIVLAHHNANEANRKFEETDLLANYPQAYAPTGCNEKIGG